MQNAHYGRWYGALVALEMMNKYPECIRSVIMLNPCLDLPEYVEFEKEHKFFIRDS